MTAILEKLAFYWTYPFVRYALIVGVLIALCSSLLGVTLVLKRFSFIGDGLSHVAFGAMSVAAVLGLTDDMPLTLGVTVVCAVLLLRTGQNTKIKGDAAVAILPRAEQQDGTDHRDAQRQRKIVRQPKHGGNGHGAERHMGKAVADEGKPLEHQRHA